MNIVKRDGREVEFDKRKIKKAIVKAMRYGSGIYLPDIARLIANDAERYYEKRSETPTVALVENYVFKRLVHYGQEETARAYENYRSIQAFKRETNTTDESILGLVEQTNEEVINENSNKNATIASTQRDLIAGEISKDITRRRLLPAHLVQAHDEGALHIHDLDYQLQPIFNCCLPNIKDMLDNGTVINGKTIESPKSFQVASTVLTQIIAQISSGQFGGQTIAIKHLGKYLRRSKEKYKKLVFGENQETKEGNELVEKLLRKELEAGIQTIQYQINTLTTSNGCL
ncbi:MAG: ATP-binding protein [Clostridia bacterium]|nr:ATP-binding protein [Clostridia bacterium]